MPPFHANDRERYHKAAVELSQATERIQRALQIDDPDLIAAAIALTKSALNRLVSVR